MQRKSFIPAVHDSCGKCMGYHLGKVLQNKTKRIIQGTSPSENISLYTALSLLEIFTQREGAVRPFPG